MFGEKSEWILKVMKEDGNTIIEHQETRDFLVKSIVRDISFKKQEIRYVERELKGLMSLLNFQLDTMPGHILKNICIIQVDLYFYSQ